MEEVKKYLSLEQIRFGSRLHVHYDVDESTLSKLIPPAIILTLAENAIKHGVAKQSGECTLNVNARLISAGLYLEMINPGTIEMKKQTGLGLQNIKRRLHHLFGERASFLLSESSGKVSAQMKIVEP
jgi:two-component system, LytTR family, sensor kinase